LTSFEHLYFFNQASLTRVLAKCGLSVVGLYSQGEGTSAARPETAGLKALLRRLGLLTPARALVRAFDRPESTLWTDSNAFHTLLVVARREGTGAN
jgi:hypothetical protein